MQNLITCHRCRARVELATDGRGHLIEIARPCTSPPNPMTQDLSRVVAIRAAEPETEGGTDEI